MHSRLYSLCLLLAFSISAHSQKPRCESNPEHKQLDFWVGQWDVTSEGRKIASSDIQRILHGCVIFENYSQGSDYEGKSFTFYDSVLKKWRQTWVDHDGNVSEFSGSFKDGAMQFEGVTHRPRGVKVMRRMVLRPLSDGRVRQFSLASEDGKTWSVAYDFVYVRK